MDSFFKFIFDKILIKRNIEIGLAVIILLFLVISFNSEKEKRIQAEFRGDKNTEKINKDNDFIRSEAERPMRGLRENLKDKELKGKKEEVIEAKDKIIMTEAENFIYEDLLSIELTEKNAVFDYMLDVIDKDDLEILTNKILVLKDDVKDKINMVPAGTDGVRFLNDYLELSIDKTKEIVYHIKYGTKKSTLKDKFDE